MPRHRLEREDSPSLATVLEAISDADCRELIESMAEPRTAEELSNLTDIPESTTYRKLELLSKATLVDEIIEIRDDGRHTSKYYPDFERVELMLTDDRNIELEFSRPARSPDERLEDLWSEVRKGV